MKQEDIKDGMGLHYTSIIGRGPSVPVVVSGEPYRVSNHWCVRVVRTDGSQVIASVDALYKRAIADGVERWRKSRGRSARS